MKNKKNWIKQGWPPLAAVILFLLIWQVAVEWTGVEKWILPAPTDIAHEGIANFSRIWMHTAATIRITLIGFAAGVACGIVAALLLHVVPGFKSAFYPLLLISQNIHPSALGPLLMIWFGFGLLPKVIVIGLVCFFPVTVAMLDGLSRPDPVMLSYMRMIGAGRYDIMRKLELPSALPNLFSGLKIAAAYSVMAAVIAEWLGASEGIGVYIVLSKNSFHTTRVFVAIVVIIILSFVLFGLVALAEKLVIRWNPKQQGG